MKVRSSSPSSRSFWLGMVMSVSTCSVSIASPSSARRALWRPSKRNGLVTTPTVRAPSSCAICAMMGAAPVPVPPPMPAVTKTMSAPEMSSLMRWTSSRAALRPRSGSAPAPRPRVTDGADGELGRSRVRVQRLSVGVDDDELDPFEAEVDHRVDGVAAGAPNADHLDAGFVLPVSRRRTRSRNSFDFLPAPRQCLRASLSLALKELR